MHLLLRACVVKMREAQFFLSLRVDTSTPACSEDVVDVDFGDEIAELNAEIHALLCDANHIWHVPVAVKGNELLVHLLVH